MDDIKVMEEWRVSQYTKIFRFGYPKYLGPEVRLKYRLRDSTIWAAGQEPPPPFSPLYGTGFFRSPAAILLGPFRGPSYCGCTYPPSSPAGEERDPFRGSGLL